MRRSSSLKLLIWLLLLLTNSSRSITYVLGMHSKAGTASKGTKSGDGRQQQTTFVANKCVFILASGRSGSTALMDALNQIPHYLIRGENWRALGSLFHAYEKLQMVAKDPTQGFLGVDGRSYQSFQAVKEAYNAEARNRKLPLFTEFPDEHAIYATRAYYNVLFGHFGKEIVSGFKEIRYVCGHFLGDPDVCPKVFHEFMRFLRRLCLDVKMIFNTRSSSTYETNSKLIQMDNSSTANQLRFAQALQLTHELYDSYTKDNPDHAFRMYLEDMMHPMRSMVLSKKLLRFLGEDTSLRLKFDRMPAWNNES